MTRSRITLIGALWALILALGCGRGDEQTTRFNTVLGGSAAPTAGNVDQGILGDPAAYKPAVSGASLGAGGGGAPKGEQAAAADGPEATAVKKSMGELIDGVTTMSASGILAAFDPAKTEALKKADFESSLTNLLSAIENTQKVIRAKADPDRQAIMDSMGEIIPAAVRLLTSNTRVTVNPDGQTALLFIDPPTEAAVDDFLKQHGERLVEIVKSSVKDAPPNSIPPQVAGVIDTLSVDTIKQFVAGAQQAREAARQAQGDAGGVANAGMGIPFRNTGDRWTIEVPFAINDELAEALKEGATLAQEALSNLASAVDAAPSLQDPSISAAMLPAMGPLMEWSNRISQLFEEAMGGAASEPTTPEPGTEQPVDAPVPDNPRSPRVKP